MRFQSKPKEIEAIRLTEDAIFPSHVKLRQSTTQEGYIVYNPKTGDWVHVKMGDWIRVDIEDDVYPIPDDYMLKNYDPI